MSGIKKTALIRQKINKYCRLLFLQILLLVGNTFYAQTNFYIGNSLSLEDLEIFTNRYPTANELTARYFVFPDQLLTESILLDWDSEHYLLNKDFLAFRDSTNFSVSYVSNEMGMFLTYCNNQWCGYFLGLPNNFTLAQLRHNTYVVYIDDETIDYEDDIEKIDDLEPSHHYSMDLSSTSTADTVIKVLVMATPTADSQQGGMMAIAQNRIDFLNRSLICSGAHARVELVYYGITQDSEQIDDDGQVKTGRTVRDFSSTSGSFTEVHSLRSLYGADICVLFIINADHCGEAKNIPATERSAFCVVSNTPGCLNQFSFEHEIGHLIGCRHNYENDILVHPKPYGHGFVHVDEDNSFRTIMSYRNPCGDYNCNRIPYWSTPGVIYQGVTIGDNSLRNNARVWTERASIVSNLVTEPIIGVLDAAAVDKMEYGNMEAISQIVSNGSVDINPGVVLDLKANDFVRLTPGFHAKAGSRVHITTNQVSSSSSTNSIMSAPRQNETTTATPQLASIKHVSISPNPVHDVLTIEGCESLMPEINIYSIQGQLVSTSIGTPCDRTPQGLRTSADVSALPNGIYLLTCNDNGHITQHKFIKQ